MKLKFKIQTYQTNAVDAVLDCFAGQPKSDALRYRIDPGRTQSAHMFDEGFKDADIRLTYLITSPRRLKQLAVMAHQPPYIERRNRSGT